MKYMLMIYESERNYGSDRSGAALEGMIAKHMAFAESLGAAFVHGAGLKETATATTVRTAKGAKSIHDGPFAETKEQLGGYYVVDVADLDAAIALARRVPLLADGAIEVRPLMSED